MNKTAVVTDTNSGITAEQAKKHGIFMIPMPVLIDGKTYFEGVDLDHKELYRQMRADADVSTSQPSVGDVTELWDKVLETYDDLIYIPMSSGLSSSCDTSKAISSEYDGRVQVADTHRISVTMKHCVYDAVALANRGKNAAEILKELEDNAFNSVVYLGVDTLKYFRKSGRVTAGAAAIASVLNIKPILITEGGKFDSFAKVRGLENCKAKIIEALKAEFEGRFAGVPKENIRIATAGTFESPDDAEKWRSDVQKAFPGFDIIYDELSCSIACHTGIGAVGVGISKVLPDAVS